MKSAYFAHCIFCRILETEEAEDFNWVSPRVASFVPLDPVIPGHRLFVHRIHTDHAAEYPAVSAQTMVAVCQVAQSEPFYRQANIITSIGPDATQSVFHTHIHLVPRAKGDGLLLPWSNQVKSH